MITQLNGRFYYVMEIEKDLVPLMLSHFKIDQPKRGDAHNLQHRVCWFPKDNSEKRISEWKTVTRLEMDVIANKLNRTQPQNIYFVETQPV